VFNGSNQYYIYCRTLPSPSSSSTEQPQAPHQTHEYLFIALPPIITAEIEKITQTEVYRDLTPVVQSIRDESLQILGLKFKLLNGKAGKNANTSNNNNNTGSNSNNANNSNAAINGNTDTLAKPKVVDRLKTKDGVSKSETGRAVYTVGPHKAYGERKSGYGVGGKVAEKTEKSEVGRLRTQSEEFKVQQMGRKPETISTSRFFSEKSTAKPSTSTSGILKSTTTISKLLPRRTPTPPPPEGEMFVYSPEPRVNVTVLYEDYRRLEEGEFLDDTVIEFYLR
ncbi:hypothetical protein HK098_000681, partial [Nowakowskiella sp. JEL0407]